MRDLRAAVIEDIRSSIAPTRVVTEQPGTIPLPYGWLRLPSTSPGRVRTIPRFMAGTLLLDLWYANQAELDLAYLALGWMNGHAPVTDGAARGIRYWEASWTSLREPTAYHGSLLWDLEYFDARRGMAV